MIYFLLNSYNTSSLLDPDPHSQYGSGCRGAKTMRVDVDPDPQYFLLDHYYLKIRSCPFVIRKDLMYSYFSSARINGTQIL
jgi:hypothetical protein